jgi:hypothetical protein
VPQPQRELQTQIDIAATPERVWLTLIDFSSYPSWNPFVTEASGDLRLGGRLRVRIAPPGGRAMVFKPAVITFDEHRELRWRGRLVLASLFQGEHYFRIEPIDEGTTRLYHGEQFSGLLVPLLWSQLQREAKPGFELMNRALKARVERPFPE